MVSVLAAVMQIAGLAVALAALVLGWHFGVLAAGVAAFLVGGHLRRRQLDPQS